MRWDARADYDPRVRALAFDYGRKRIGVAVSDPSGTIARPLTMLPGDRADTVDQAVALVTGLTGEEAGLDAIVIGLPCRLDGTPHDLTDDVRAFAAGLAARVNVPIVFQDERLSSHEADTRLAATERSWRRRKARLDAAAAAVILQDYLDAQYRGRDS
ncbi:MAG: Holliday junction resolvase RuvX [Chloroflexi bacterium]|nr:Holliday junction resolvase RuvX [Chloroflexota bacterium]